MTPQDGSYRIVARHSGRGLEIKGMSLEDGAELQQFERIAGSTNQMFRVEAVDDTFFRIIALHSGKCLEVQSGSIKNGARIQQFDFLGGDNQLFRFSEEPDGFCRILAKHSGKGLDVDGNSSENGARIQQFEDISGSSNQVFLLKPALSAVQIKLVKALLSALSQFGATPQMIELFKRCKLDTVPWTVATFATASPAGGPGHTAGTTLRPGRSGLPEPATFAACLEAMAATSSANNCLRAIEIIGKTLTGAGPSRRSGSI